MKASYYKSHGHVLVALAVMLATAMLCLFAKAQVAPQSTVPSGPAAEQEAFATPQEAAKALVTAASTDDIAALLKLFGPSGKDLFSSADPVRDQNSLKAFVTKAEEKQVVAIDSKNANRAILSVGADSWPLPVPIVKEKGKWFFDTKEGHDELLLRRIGANELDAIQICHGYVEAQREYASVIHDNSGVNQYAQQIMSSPGKQDGLYWINSDGSPGGPIGEEAARALEEGYTANGKGLYHGYYFKILKGQGPAAHLGQLDYVIQGVMIGGFALVAVPAEYRVTGVQTFIVNQDGIVYQKDLGPKSLDVVKEMELYNPDKTWRRTNDQWPETALNDSDK